MTPQPGLLSACACCHSVLKGDKPAADSHSLEDTPLNYGWAPFNGDNGQVGGKTASLPPDGILQLHLLASVA